MSYKEFKEKYNGKYLDYDGAYNSQCWDLAQYYFTECLGLPASILSGCGLVSNMLDEPKISLLLKYFDEVPTTAMNPGDVVIWSVGHIAIFDNWDGSNCYYLTQNPGATKIGLCNLGGTARAFRLKGTNVSTNTSNSNSIKVGSKVRIGTMNGETKWIADDVQVKYGIYQIREDVNAGGTSAFNWKDNGIPETCVDLTDSKGNKRADSDRVHAKKGDYFVFAKTFTVVKTVVENGKTYLLLDFDSNHNHRFWVIKDYCYLV